MAVLSDLLRMELRTVVSHYVVIGTEPGSSRRAEPVLKPQGFLYSPGLYVLCGYHSWITALQGRLESSLYHLFLKCWDYRDHHTQLPLSQLFAVVVCKDICASLRFYELLSFFIFL